MALIRNLCRAMRENRKRAMIERAVGLSVAVSHALEAALGGKGKILPTWIDYLERSEEAGEARGGQAMSDRARQFFQSLPERKEKQ